MIQLDLFEKNVVRRPQEVIKRSKYKHRYAYDENAKPYPVRKLRTTRIDCSCKQAVNVYYDFVEPKESSKIPRWDEWGKLSYDRFEQTRDMCYCPGCGVKLYIMNAKIKFIEVN
jgi:hypothetical protein